MVKASLDLGLPTAQSLFAKTERYDESNFKDIVISQIDDFPDHPFQVKDDDDMTQLVESIKEHGVITPAIVRKKENGRYELVAGHRRKRASELAGLRTLKCEVVDITDDEATIFMVDSNFQRSTILPSEKAFAYKMRLEAIKRQAGRPSKNNLVPVGQNFSRQELASKIGESQTQIQRYIRLTNLVSELLDYVDEGRIKIRPAVELSYLDETSQYYVLEVIKDSHKMPSYEKTTQIRCAYNDGELTLEEVQKIMNEEKPKEEKKTIQWSRYDKYFPRNYTVEQKDKIIQDLLSEWKKNTESTIENK